MSPGRVDLDTKSARLISLSRVPVFKPFIIAHLRHATNAKSVHLTISLIIIPLKNLFTMLALKACIIARDKVKYLWFKSSAKGFNFDRKKYFISQPLQNWSIQNTEFSLCKKRLFVNY